MLLADAELMLLADALCRVQQLSLRHNGITDIGAKQIGLSLGNFTRQNQKLVSLNLTGNKIGDMGVCHIAEVRLHGCNFDIFCIKLHILLNDVNLSE